MYSQDSYVAASTTSASATTTTTKKHEVTPSAEEIAEDQRHDWILQRIAKECTVQEVVDHYRQLLKEHREKLEDFFADRTTTKYLFLWRSQNPRAKNEPHPIILDLEDEDDDEDYNGYDDENKLKKNEFGQVDGKATLSLKEMGYRIDTNGLGELHSPIHFQAFILTRLKKGYIPTMVSSTESSNHSEPPCGEYLQFGVCFGSAFKHVNQVIESRSAELDKYFQSAEMNLHKTQDLLNAYQVSDASEAGSNLLHLSMESCPFLFNVPFQKTVKDIGAEDLEQLRAICLLWSQDLSATIKHFRESSYQSPGAEAQVEQLIQLELNWWRNRQMELGRLQSLFNLPLNRRLLYLIGRHDEAIRSKFTNYIHAIEELYDEAKDNTTTLTPIAMEVDLALKTDDFEVVKSVLRKVLKTLRHAWMLSKQYSSDEKIVTLLVKITNIVLSRVQKSVQLSNLENVDALSARSLESVSLLHYWERQFHETRLEIESSGRENRWELPIFGLFSRVNHVKSVCQDVSKVAETFQNLRSVFSDPFKEAIQNQGFMQGILKKIRELEQSFETLSFGMFSKNEAHHWRNQLNWFYREVRFLEIHFLGEIDDVFDQLSSADAAIRGVKHILIHKNHPQCIREAITHNIDKVMVQFIHEINQTDQDFQRLRSTNNPPSIPGLPPIAGSIMWTQQVLNTMQTPLEEMTSLPEFTSNQQWERCSKLFQLFQDTLVFYQKSRYDEWCLRVSDILNQNLTRSLLIGVDDPREDIDLTGSHHNKQEPIPGYKVNFTSDLSDTLAEVKYLESQGFAVPKLARNMSIQESRLLKLASDLNELTTFYSQTVQLLKPAERELMREEIERTRTKIWPGQDRLTWNSLGTHTFIARCTNQISILLIKVEEVNRIGNNIAKCVDQITTGQLLRMLDEGEGIKNGSGGYQTKKQKASCIPEFSTFLNHLVGGLQARFQDLLAIHDDISPNLLKAEEILFQSRTMRTSAMTNYYQHWEEACYKALVKMVLSNLDEYVDLLERDEPSFSVQVVLLANEVILQPDPSNVIELVLNVVKKILEGTKQFRRHYRGTWIPSLFVTQGNNIKDCGSSFYDDIILLPDVKSKVDQVQTLLADTIKSIHTYLGEWKSFRNLWAFSKENTCQVFIATSPSCIKFDEKLLFYHNIKREVLSKPNERKFRAILLNLVPLKMSLIKHIQEWIDTLGIYLDKTSKQTLALVSEKVISLSDSLTQCTNPKQMEWSVRVIGAVEDNSLEVEMAFKDMHERFRTLNMYGIEVSQDDVQKAQHLPMIWHELFIKAKVEHFRLRSIQDLHKQRLAKRVTQFAKKVALTYRSFQERGPATTFTSLVESNVILNVFKNKLSVLLIQQEQMVQSHQVLKLPIPYFAQLFFLAEDIRQNSEILSLYNEYQDVLEVIRKVPISEFPQDIPFEDLGHLQSRLCSYGPDMRQTNQQLSFLDSLIQRTDHSLQLVRLYRDHNLSLKLWNRHYPSDEQALGECVSSFLDFEPDLLEEKLSHLIEAVQSEVELANHLQVINAFWQNQNFEFQKMVLDREPSKHLVLIKNLDQSLDQGVKHAEEVKSMFHLPKAAHLMPDIQSLKATLFQIVGILTIWTRVQASCFRLVRILYFQPLQLEEEFQLYAQFDEDFKQYSRLMSDVTKRPSISKACHAINRLSDLFEFERIFANHNMTLKAIVEARTEHLPRLRFLPFSMILSLLGGWHENEGPFQAAICHLFGYGVTQLAIKETNLGNFQCALVLGNGESLEILRDVSTFQRIEDFISSVLHLAKLSLEHFVALSLANKPPFPAKDISTSFDLSQDAELIQVSLLRLEVAFSQSIETTMDDPQLRKELLRYFIRQSKEFAESITTGERMKGLNETLKNRNFLQWFRSKSQLLVRLLDYDVTKEHDFQWQSCLRYYWNNRTTSVTVHQGLAKLSYAYEFQHLEMLAFETDHSERYQYAMTQAIAENKSLLVQGPALSGKRTTFVDLAKRLGQFYVVREVLSPINALSTFLTFLSSVCQAGCWGLIGGLDFIHWESLCTLTNTFRNLHDAYSKRLREFELISNQKIQLGLSAVVACKYTLDLSTTLDDTKGSLPPSLTHELRPVSVIVPQCKPLLLARFPTLFQENKMLHTFESGIDLLLSHPTFLATPKLCLYSRLKNEAAARLSQDPNLDELTAICQALVLLFQLTGDPDLERWIGDQFSLQTGKTNNKQLLTSARVVGLNCTSSLEDIDQLLYGTFGEEITVCRSSLNDCSVDQFWGYQNGSGTLVPGRLADYPSSKTSKTFVILSYPQNPENQKRLWVLQEQNGFVNADNTFISMPQNVCLVLVRFIGSQSLESNIGLPLNKPRESWDFKFSQRILGLLNLPKSLQVAASHLLKFWHDRNPTHCVREVYQNAHQFSVLWTRRHQKLHLDSDSRLGSDLKHVIFCFFWSFGLQWFAFDREDDNDQCYHDLVRMLRDVVDFDHLKETEEVEDFFALNLEGDKRWCCWASRYDNFVQVCSEALDHDQDILFVGCLRLKSLLTHQILPFLAEALGAKLWNNVKLNSVLEHYEVDDNGELNPREASQRHLLSAFDGMELLASTEGSQWANKANGLGLCPFPSGNNSGASLHQVNKLNLISFLSHTEYRNYLQSGSPHFERFFILHTRPLTVSIWLSIMRSSELSLKAASLTKICEEITNMIGDDAFSQEPYLKTILSYLSSANSQFRLLNEDNENWPEVVFHHFFDMLNSHWARKKVCQILAPHLPGVQIMTTGTNLEEPTKVSLPPTLQEGRSLLRHYHLRRQSKVICLFGEVGVGKRALAQSLATETKSNFKTLALEDVSTIEEPGYNVFYVPHYWEENISLSSGRLQDILSSWSGDSNRDRNSSTLILAFVPRFCSSKLILTLLEWNLPIIGVSSWDSTDLAALLDGNNGLDEVVSSKWLLPFFEQWMSQPRKDSYFRPNQFLQTLRMATSEIKRNVQWLDDEVKILDQLFVQLNTFLNHMTSKLEAQDKARKAISKNRIATQAVHQAIKEKEIFDSKTQGKLRQLRQSLVDQEDNLQQSKVELDNLLEKPNQYFEEVRNLFQESKDEDVASFGFFLESHKSNANTILMLCSLICNWEMDDTHETINWIEYLREFLTYFCNMEQFYPTITVPRRQDIANSPGFTLTDEEMVEFDEQIRAIFKGFQTLWDGTEIFVNNQEESEDLRLRISELDCIITQINDEIHQLESQWAQVKDEILECQERKLVLEKELITLNDESIGLETTISHLSKMKDLLNQLAKELWEQEHGQVSEMLRQNQKNALLLALERVVLPSVNLSDRQEFWDCLSSIVGSLDTVHTSNKHNFGFLNDHIKLIQNFHASHYMFYDPYLVYGFLLHNTDSHKVIYLTNDDPECELVKQQLKDERDAPIVVIINATIRQMVSLLMLAKPTIIFIFLERPNFIMPGTIFYDLSMEVNDVLAQYETWIHLDRIQERRSIQVRKERQQTELKDQIARIFLSVDPKHLTEKEEQNIVDLGSQVLSLIRAPQPDCLESDSIESDLTKERHAKILALLRALGFVIQMGLIHHISLKEFICLSQKACVTVEELFKNYAFRMNTNEATFFELIYGLCLDSDAAGSDRVSDLLEVLRAIEYRPSIEMVVESFTLQQVSGFLQSCIFERLLTIQEQNAKLWMHISDLATDLSTLMVEICSSWESVLLAIIFRPRYLLLILRQYLTNFISLGNLSSHLHQIDLFATLTDTSCQPIILLVEDSYLEPLHHVAEIGLSLGLTNSKIYIISSGYDSLGPQILSMAYKRSQWLLIQNLSSSARIVNMCAQFSAQSVLNERDTTDNGFRLVISTTRSSWNRSIASKFLSTCANVILLDSERNLQRPLKSSPNSPLPIATVLGEAIQNLMNQWRQLNKTDMLFWNKKQVLDLDIRDNIQRMFERVGNSIQTQTVNDSDVRTLTKLLHYEVFQTISPQFTNDIRIDVLEICFLVISHLNKTQCHGHGEEHMSVPSLVLPRFSNLANTLHDGEHAVCACFTRFWQSSVVCKSFSISPEMEEIPSKSLLEVQLRFHVQLSNAENKRNQIRESVWNLAIGAELTLLYESLNSPISDQFDMTRLQTRICQINELAQTENPRLCVLTKPQYILKLLEFGGYRSIVALPNCSKQSWNDEITGSSSNSIVINDLQLVGGFWNQDNHVEQEHQKVSVKSLLLFAEDRRRISPMKFVAIPCFTGESYNPYGWRFLTSIFVPVKQTHPLLSRQVKFVMLKMTK